MESLPGQKTHYKFYL